MKIILKLMKTSIQIEVFMLLSRSNKNYVLWKKITYKKFMNNK